MLVEYAGPGPRSWRGAKGKANGSGRSCRGTHVYEPCQVAPRVAPQPICRPVSTEYPVVGRCLILGRPVAPIRYEVRGRLRFEQCGATIQPLTVRILQRGADRVSGGLSRLVMCRPRRVLARHRLTQGRPSGDLLRVAGRCTFQVTLMFGAPWPGLSVCGRCSTWQLVFRDEGRRQIQERWQSGRMRRS